MAHNRSIPLWAAPVLILAALAAEGPPATRPQGPLPPGPTPMAPGRTATPAPPPPQHLTAEQKRGQAILDAAIHQVRGYHSLSADLSQTAEMLGYRFIAWGSYKQSQDYRMRLELHVKLGGPATTRQDQDAASTVGSLLEVSDGSALSTAQQILDAADYGRIDLKPILQVLHDPKTDSNQRTSILHLLNLSGPAALLEGLRDMVLFDTIQEQTLHGRTVYVMQGAWGPRAIERINSVLRPGIRFTLDTLPNYMPRRAALYLGKADGWPYKLEMEGENSKKPASRDEPAQFRGKFLLEYTNVQFNPPLLPSTFVYQPPHGADVHDNTEQYVRVIDQIKAASSGKPPATSSGRPSPPPPTQTTPPIPLPAGEDHRG